MIPVRFLLLRDFFMVLTLYSGTGFTINEGAEKKGIGGPPTVWMDGRDLEPEAPPPGIS
jgi:hypothetical protein